MYFARDVFREQCFSLALFCAQNVSPKAWILLFPAFGTSRIAKSSILSHSCIWYHLRSQKLDFSVMHFVSSAYLESRILPISAGCITRVANSADLPHSVETLPKTCSTVSRVHKFSQYENAWTHFLAVRRPSGPLSGTREIFLTRILVVTKSRGYKFSCNQIVCEKLWFISVWYLLLYFNKF